MSKITCKQIKNRVCSCDNCNRITPFIMEYKFIDVTVPGIEISFNIIHLCEDCSNAISNLFHNVMEEGKPFKYEKDEIKELEEIKMGCTCAKYEEDENRYYCSVSGSGCVYMSPDSKACAKEYGEGPDANNESEEI